MTNTIHQPHLSEIDQIIISSVDLVGVVLTNFVVAFPTSMKRSRGLRPDFGLTALVFK